MKNLKLNILLAISISVIMLGCNSYDFGQEQYTKEVDLLQDNEGIYSRQVVDMNNAADGNGVLNLVAGLSGSLPSTQAYPITIMPSDSLFKAYNKSNFDIDTSRYAHLLPADCYEEPSLNMVIKAGESSVKFPFKIKNLERLSPDSTYFLNYEIDPVTTTPINKKKNHVLLRVHWKNEFASTATQMDYSYTSTQVIEVPTDVSQASTVYRPTNTLRAFPLTKNAVRFMAGNETYNDYSKALDKINQASIVIEVGAKTARNPLARNITIRPYRNDQIEVIMLTPQGEYDNTFLLNELANINGGNATYYKEFRVHYKYRLLKVKNADGSYAPGPIKEVKGKLRYQYNPRAEQL